MSTNNKKQQWEAYCTEQLTAITPLLVHEGFVLDTEQPHIQGERYVLSGPKLVLYGARESDGLRVVIKITDNAQAAHDLELERDARDLLSNINFAYHTFRSPEEVLFGRHEAYTFFITEYVPQKKKFLERPLEEQFFLALKAFEAQEGSHATTHGHLQTVGNTFEVFTANRYLETLTQYEDAVRTLLPGHARVHDMLSKAKDALQEKSALLDRYSNFLTHWDFVPHNFRIHEGHIYLLDHTAIRFGNKYEGWARFMNFMTLYHHELERILDQYVRENRSKDEYSVLSLMRLYRLSELVWFYASKRERAEDDLLTLTDARIDLWTSAIEAQLQGESLGASVIDAYKRTRDSLRDEDEKGRQQRLH